MGRIGLTSSFTVAKCLEYCLLSAGVELEKRRPDTWRSSVQKKLDVTSRLRTGGRVDYRQLTGTNSWAKRLAEWMIRSGRLGQFSLARRLFLQLIGSGEATLIGITGCE